MEVYGLFYKEVCTHPHSGSEICSAGKKLVFATLLKVSLGLIVKE
jgi:hypothetical protein